MIKEAFTNKALKEELEKQETLRYEKLREEVLSNISVVVQGKIFGAPGDSYEKQLTLQCVESIRNFMPKAEIILSTWEGSVVDHLSYDKVIYNQDPGAVSYSELKPDFLNNNNRQILSTYNGLKAATNKYAVKMRGDCKFIDTDFICYFKEYARAQEFRFFKQRVIIPTKYSRNPRRIAQLIHPSDIFQAGLLEDLRDLWNIPLQPEPQTTRAYPPNKKILNNALFGGIHRMKFGAEQYIWYSFCKKYGLDLELKHHSHIPASKILASEMSVINNFVIVEAINLGVLIPKKFTLHFDGDLYTHDEWYRLNKKYVRGISKFFEWKLISQVYFNNMSKIIWRFQNKLLSHGVKSFFVTLKHYVISR